jgi:amino acid adenylation domain-containing protein
LKVDLETLTGILGSSAGIIPVEAIQNLVEQFCHIIACIPTSTSCSIPPFVPKLASQFCADESENICCKNVDSLTTSLSILNPNPVKVAGPQLLHKLVAHGLHGSGEAIAMEVMEENGERYEISYRKLRVISDTISGNICKFLDRLPNRRMVPILLPQGALLHVAILSILKAGAAYVPLSLDAPEERIRYIVNDVNAGLVITISDLAKKIQWQDAPQLFVLDKNDLNENFYNSEIPAEIPTESLLPTAIAYIMYTSGSTGNPKGVMISHSAVTQSLLVHDKYIPRYRRFLQFAAPTFDVAVFETFFTWFRGSTLVCCDRERLLADLPKVINELEIDAAELTPTVAGELLGARQAVPRLDILLTIGEMLTHRVVDGFGGGPLQGMYGPTEAAIHCTIATNIQKHGKVGDIGVPFNTVSAFIIAPQSASNDSELTILPVGWVGELALGGWQLADGYLNSPENTRDAFFNSVQWGRLYRTGDLARILPSGRIECLGRVSAGQVKIRGQRVEIGEIEAAVAKTHCVKTAVVLPINGSLVAFVSTSSNLVNSVAVKTECRKWLPGFMVPTDVVFYQDLPQLPSGKTDRKKLELDYCGCAQEDTREAIHDWNEREITIAGVVEQILNIRPSKHGSLFTMGLDSLGAIKLVAQLRIQGIGVGVLDVIKLDSISKIASSAVISSACPPETEALKIRLETFFKENQSKLPLSLLDKIDDIIPCTSLQNSMIAETIIDGAAYCNWILFELPPTAEYSHVELAFKEIVQRNEILRTGFLSLDDGFAQVIWKTMHSTQLTNDDVLGSVWHVMSNGILVPPFCARFIIEESGCRRLGLNIHHALYDGWSLEHIIADFGYILDGISTLSRRPQFRDVVEWELMRDPSYIESTKEFWKSMLSGAGATRMPNFHGRRNINSGTSVDFRFLSASFNMLESSARMLGVTPQAILQSAWAFLLSTYVGKDDVVFGTVLSGRTLPIDGIEEIIGPTIQTLPFRMHTSLCQTIAVSVKAAHDLNRELLKHPGLGLRDVRKVCDEEDGVFDSLLVWQQTANNFKEPSIRIIESKDKLEVCLESPLSCI